MVGALSGALGLALFACFLQWVAVQYFIPWWERTSALKHAERQEQKKRDAAEAEAHAKALKAHEIAEKASYIAPAPRVRTIAWCGSVEDATAAPLPPHARKLARQSSVRRNIHQAKVWPVDGATSAAPAAATTPADDDKAAAAAADADDESEPVIYGRMSGVLCAPFFLVQSVLNGAFAFALTWAIFTVVLLYVPPQSVTDPPLLLLTVSAPFLAALFGGVFTPVALPEAADKGWIGFVEAASLPTCLACLPFFQHYPALIRLLLIGTLAAALWVPCGLLVVAFALTLPVAPAFAAIFGGVYVFCLCLTVVPLGHLSFYIEPNFARCLAVMSREPGRCQRYSNRLCAVVRC